MILIQFIFGEIDQENIEWEELECFPIWGLWFFQTFLDLLQFKSSDLKFMEFWFFFKLWNLLQFKSFDFIFLIWKFSYLL